MKKPYMKPLIYAETFALTEHISESCGLAGKANQGNALSCTFDQGNNAYAFYEGLTTGNICTVKVPYDTGIPAELVDPVPSIECYIGTFDGNTGGTFAS